MVDIALAEPDQRAAMPDGVGQQAGCLHRSPDVARESGLVAIEELPVRRRGLTHKQRHDALGAITAAEGFDRLAPRVHSAL